MTLRYPSGRRLHANSLHYWVMVLLLDGGEWTVRGLSEALSGPDEPPEDMRCIRSGLAHMLKVGWVERVNTGRPARWQATSAVREAVTQDAA